MNGAQILAVVSQILWACVICFVAWTCSARAQHPGPDYPDGPIDPIIPYIEVWGAEEFVINVNALNLGRFYAMGRDLDENSKDGRCEKVIKVKEPRNLYHFCPEGSGMQTMKLPSGEALYTMMPPGCVSVHTWMLEEKIEVYRDFDCWILFWNETEKPKEPLKGV